MVNTLARSMKEIVPTSLCSFALENVTSDLHIPWPLFCSCPLWLLCGIWHWRQVFRWNFNLLLAFEPSALIIRLLSLWSLFLRLFHCTFSPLILHVTPHTHEFFFVYFFSTRTLCRLQLKPALSLSLTLTLSDLYTVVDSRSWGITTWVFPRRWTFFRCTVAVQIYSSHLSALPTHRWFLILNPTSWVWISWCIERAKHLRGFERYHFADTRFWYIVLSWSKDSTSGPEEYVNFKVLLRGSHPGVVTAQAPWVCCRGQWQKEGPSVT